MILFLMYILLLFFNFLKNPIILEISKQSNQITDIIISSSRYSAIFLLTGPDIS